MQNRSRAVDFRGAPVGVDSQKRESLRSLLACVYPSVARLERRGERRYPYPYLVRLTPLAPDGRTPLDESIVVVGKQISEHGLGFYHHQPLAFRQAIATLDRAEGSPVDVQIDLTWCRFTRHGWYESGGRFIQVITRGGQPDPRIDQAKAS